MANRVLIGKRGSNYGLYVSREGIDVTDTTNTTPLSFSSDAASGLTVHSYGEGVLVAPLNGTNTSITVAGTTYTNTTIAITHNLGYIPAYAVRWTPCDQLNSSNVATRTYHPVYMNTTDYECNEEADDGTCEEYGSFSQEGGIEVEIDNTYLTITNHNNNDDSFYNYVHQDSMKIAYAYIIFNQPNFLNGRSL